MLAEGLEETDTAGRWLAHHLADLLELADMPEASTRDKRRAEKLIIALWEHKASLPMADPPLNSFKPILRALERLDPQRKPWVFYGRTPVGLDETVPGNIELVLAEALDRIAGDVIRFFLEEAMKKAAVAEGTWISASASQAENDDSVIGNLIRAMEPEKTAADYLDDRISLMKTARSVCDKTLEELKLRRAQII